MFKRFAALTAVLVICAACGSNPGGPSPPAEKHAHFILVSSSQSMTTYGCPQITGTVKNDGNAAGYNVMITFSAYNSANTIIDTASGFPADLATIPVGISATFDAVFFDLSSWSQINKTTYVIDWLDVTGTKFTQTGLVK